MLKHQVLTEKPTPRVSLGCSLCFRLKSPLAEGECTNLRLSPSFDSKVMPALGVAFLLMAAGWLLG